MSEQRRYLVFGAHPDDADIGFGGTAVKLIRAGHLVKFVSVTNGNCGHLTMNGEQLAHRRYLESQKSKEISGLCEYQVLDINDCEVEPTLENRRKIIEIIRDFAPDVVLSHRLCDYHADHRNTAQLVLDAAYLIGVPQFVRNVPIPAKNPVFGHLYDIFDDPRPFRADAAVPVDDVENDKCLQLNCHESQFYEWLAWEKGESHLNFAAMSWDEKKTYLKKHWFGRFEKEAALGREILRLSMGNAADQVRYAEVFEYSPYGREVSKEEFRALFP